VDRWRPPRISSTCHHARFPIRSSYERLSKPSAPRQEQQGKNSRARAEGQEQRGKSRRARAEGQEQQGKSSKCARRGNRNEKRHLEPGRQRKSKLLRLLSHHASPHTIVTRLKHTRHTPQDQPRILNKQRLVACKSAVQRYTTHTRDAPTNTHELNMQGPSSDHAPHRCSDICYTAL